MRDAKATTANGPKFLNIKDDHLDISQELPDTRTADVGLDPDSALLSEQDRGYNLDNSSEKQHKSKIPRTKKRVSYL